MDDIKTPKSKARSLSEIISVEHKNKNQCHIFLDRVVSSVKWSWSQIIQACVYVPN